jgi:hypothetical protein
VDSVLADIEDKWAWSGGMQHSEYEKLQSALGPHLRRLLDVPLSDAKACADAFVREWARLRTQVTWL